MFQLVFQGLQDSLTTPKQGLFYRILMVAQPPRGPVEVVQPQILGFGDRGVAAPLIRSIVRARLEELV